MAQILHVHFVHFLVVTALHDYDVKVPNFTFCRGREHNTTALFFFSSTWQSFRTQFQNKRDKVWGSASSLFKWRFRNRRCRCCLSSLLSRTRSRTRLRTSVSTLDLGDKCGTSSIVYDDTFSPEWIPILNCRVLPGRWLILNSLRYVTKRKDILAMCPACLFPFLSGRPDTTKHESLLVSTLKIHKKK